MRAAKRNHYHDHHVYNALSHTQTCKHRQTGSSHCSSFVYTLTFSQHLSYVLYTFGKRGPFSNWGPYCSFCYKSPVWMPKQTHTHTHHTHGTCGVLDCLLYCDQMWPNYRISLVGYHCAIEFPCGVPLFHCCKYPTVPHNLHVHVWRTHSHPHTQFPIWRSNGLVLVQDVARYLATIVPHCMNHLRLPGAFTTTWLSKWVNAPCRWNVQVYYAGWHNKK